ncbi:MAG: hypothetical protein LLF94_06555 [Chlamydiales bacterium]|nr:hypothetical protein [Chlamydiales bacterium]
MNTIDKIELIPVFTNCIGRLAVATQAMETMIVPKPVFTDISGFKKFRYEEQTVYHVALLKGVRVVSGLNACLHLLAGGFVQEVMVIVRTLDDFLHEMIFILENGESGALDNQQRKFLEDFFKEEFKNPSNPLLNETRRDTVPKRKIWASVARKMQPIANPSDFQKICQITNDTLSGYVHGAYPHIMEMYGGNPPKYHVEGMLVEPRIRTCLDQIQLYTQRAITIFEGFAKDLGSKEWSEYLHTTRDYFEKETQYVQPSDMEKVVRSLKRKDDH